MKEVFAVSRADLSIPSIHGPFTDHELLRGNQHYDVAEVESLLEALYPDGISRHGTQYLHSQYSVRRLNTGEDIFAYLPVIEMVFELVRLWKFPLLPSRLTSGFACLTIEDAKIFRNKFCNGKGDIIRIEADDYFKADMSLLKSGNSIPGFMLHATKYWSGASTENPFWELLVKLPYKITEKVAG